jgi:CRP/FNR family transcriptional regulator, cyclic AMP receptor protein
VPLDAAALKEISLFEALPEKELAKLVPLFQTRSFDAGHAIAEEGKMGTGFFIIESGTAKVTVRGEQRTTLGPGSYFGEIALLDEGPRVATVTGETDLTAQMLSAWDFRSLVKEDSELAWGLLTGIAGMLRGREGYY